MRSNVCVDPDAALVVFRDDGAEDDTISYVMLLTLAS